MISETGLSLIKKWEGLRLKAYKDVAGIWTIGYGHSGVWEGMEITQQQADDYLKKDTIKAYNEVMKYDDVYHWTQNEIDALTSFAFNIGSIDQLTDLGTRSKSTIAEKMLLYCNAGGKKVQGLVNRRQDEHALFILTDVLDHTETRKNYVKRINEHITAIQSLIIELEKLC